MSFEIIDPENDAGDLDGLERELTLAVTAGDKTTDEPAGEAAEKDEPQIPEKYRGKKLEDIIEMHQNLESAYGRMANDLGQQRKFTDQLLELKRSEDLGRNTPAQEQQDEEVEISVSELLENPTAAFERYYETRRARESRDVTERLNSMETSLAQERFVSKHGDVLNEIGNDPAFVEWLTASPIRQRAAQAALQGDWQAADDLVTEFKTVRSTAAPAAKPQETTDEGVEAARQASLESANNAEASSKTSGKIYRRADLMELRLHRPEVYESEDFQREIMAAYAEGRVR